jgi:hypothetical protein
LIDFLIRFRGNYKNLNFENHIIHNAFPGKTFERKCKESGQGKQKFDIVFFNFVSWYKKWVISLCYTWNKPKLTKSKYAIYINTIFYYQTPGSGWISCTWRSQYWYTSIVHNTGIKICSSIVYQYCDLKKIFFYLCIVL